MDYTPARNGKYLDFPIGLDAEIRYKVIHPRSSI